MPRSLWLWPLLTSQGIYRATHHDNVPSVSQWVPHCSMGQNWAETVGEILRGTISDLLRKKRHRIYDLMAHKDLGGKTKENQVYS